MGISLKIKNRWGYLIAFLMLLISYFLIFFIIKKLANEAGRVSHSYDIINKLESIKGEITDAESGVRGYAITKDVRFLKPYHSGSRNVITLYRELVVLTVDNKTYKTKLDSLGKMIDKRLSDLSAFITKFQRGGFIITDDILSSRESNKQIMDNIRLLIQQLKEDEQILMNERNNKLDSFFNSTTILAIISLLIALVTIFYSLITYNRENKAKEESDRYATIYSLELEKKVNDLNLANAELEELRSIEKFAATGRIARTIAHEVRNPLTNISLASEQLKEMTSQNEEGDLLLDMIGRNVNRINQLVSDLLNSTRFEQLEYTPANINELLDEALGLARDRIELNQVKVEKYYEKNLCEILVDKEKIKLAFLNIIVNAIEAMEKDGGVLKIRTNKQGNKCTVEISDNGSGMDEETMQKLFEPYFTGKIKGNGLGLTNTQNIILNHKGNINVRSKLKEGSSFVVTLTLEDAGKK
ncbi:MAG: CHASE3 domain-containing protein [Chitinophagaceae bacterium]